MLEFSLADDGTMDTVIAVHCCECGQNWKERFSDGVRPRTYLELTEYMENEIIYCECDIRGRFTMEHHVVRSIRSRLYQVDVDSNWWIDCQGNPETGTEMYTITHSKYAIKIPCTSRILTEKLARLLETATVI